MTIEAMKQALEALEKVLPCAEENFTNPSLQIEVINAYAAITSLRQAIERAESVSSIQSNKTSDAEKQVFYSGNGTAGRENMTEPTGFFFQMPKVEEPVAWQDTRKTWVDVPLKNVLKEKREWVGLTDEEIDKCCDFPLNALGMKHVRKIEAKLKDKNGL